MISVLRSQRAFVRLSTVAHRVQSWRCGHCELGRLRWLAERVVPSPRTAGATSIRFNLLPSAAFCSLGQQTGSSARSSHSSGQ